MDRRVVKPPGQDMVVERLKSRYGLAGSCPVEVRGAEGGAEAAACSAGRRRAGGRAGGGLRPAFLWAARSTTPLRRGNRRDGRGVALVLLAGTRVQQAQKTM